jgi:hypothetical protein
MSRHFLDHSLTENRFIEGMVQHVETNQYRVQIAIIFDMGSSEFNLRHGFDEHYYRRMVRIEGKARAGTCFSRDAVSGLDRAPNDE